MLAVALLQSLKQISLSTYIFIVSLYLFNNLTDIIPVMLEAIP